MRCLITILGLVVLLVAPAPAAAAGFDHTYASYAGVLTNHVKDGRVNYRALTLSPEPLQAVLAEFSRVAPDEFALWTRARRTAFLINVYNAQTVMLITTNYPTTTMRRLGRGVISAWQLPVVRIMGVHTTLESIVSGPLRRDIDDHRVHYALCQGAKGSPPLRSEPYLPDKLDEQFADQARLFLNDPARNRVDSRRKVLWLSPVFQWNGRDFTNRQPDILKVIRPHVAKSTADLLDAATPEEPVKFDYGDFNWELNDQKAASAK